MTRRDRATSPLLRETQLARWRSDYEKDRPLQDRFTHEIQRIITTIVQQRNIDYVSIDSRTKTVDSYCEKIQRKNFKYEEPAKQIKDLTGIRIIGYYQHDCDAIFSLLENEFTVHQDDTHRAEAPNVAEFGYLSHHLVVEFNELRLGILEYGQYRGLTAEVQIRTTAQHAWSSISHKIQYKREDSMPSRIRRRLAMLSALFELADDQFAALKSEMDEIERAYLEASSLTGTIVSEEPDNSMYVDSLLRAEDLSHQMVRFAERAGFIRPQPIERFAGYYLASREELCEILITLDLGNRVDLEKMLSDQLMHEFASELCRATPTIGGTLELTPADVLSRCIVGLYGEQIDSLQDLYTGAERNTLRRIARTVRPDN